MYLKHPDSIVSITSHVPCTWKRIGIASILVLLYAVSFQYCASTVGQPREWAIGEQKRLLKIKAREAKEQGIVVNNPNELKKKPTLSIDEEELPSEWLPDAWACLVLFITVTLHLLFHLLCHWSLKFRTRFTYEKTSSIEEKTYLLCEPPKQKGKSEICKIDESELSGLSFLFQNQKYEVVDLDEISEKAKREDASLASLVCADENADPSFACRLVQSHANLPKSEYLKSRGLATEEQIEKFAEIYGHNVFELPLPSFLDLLKKQCMGPIVIFQLFCSFLWALDTYWKYTMFTLCTVIGFEASTAFQKLKSMMTLRGMGGKTYQVFVYRRKIWVQICVTELLPGDVLSLATKEDERSESSFTSSINANSVAAKGQQEAVNIPCDCVILRGSAVVNEASLTGESVPQMKDALKVDSENSTELYDMHGVDKIHSLYSGTTLIQSTKEDDVEKDFVI